MKTKLFKLLTFFFAGVISFLNAQPQRDATVTERPNQPPSSVSPITLVIKIRISKVVIRVPNALSS